MASQGENSHGTLQGVTYTVKFCWWLTIFWKTILVLSHLSNVFSVLFWDFVELVSGAGLMQGLYFVMHWSNTNWLLSYLCKMFSIICHLADILVYWIFLPWVTWDMNNKKLTLSEKIPSRHGTFSMLSFNTISTNSLLQQHWL